MLLIRLTTLLELPKEAHPYLCTSLPRQVVFLYGWNDGNGPRALVGISKWRNAEELENLVALISSQMSHGTLILSHIIVPY
jgi:hypothetical protein